MTYEFQLISDDGSRLFIDDKVVVDHDGLHGSTEMEGKVDAHQGTPQAVRRALRERRWGATDAQLAPARGGATSCWFRTPSLRAPKGEVRVTSPGNKRLVKLVPRYAPGDGGSAGRRSTRRST